MEDGFYNFGITICFHISLLKLLCKWNYRSIDLQSFIGLQMDTDSYFSQTDFFLKNQVKQSP